MESKDDIYFLIFHHDDDSSIINNNDCHHDGYQHLLCGIGIKLAHTNNFEVKLRIKKKKSGIERWKKFHGYLHQPLNLQNLDSRTLLDGVVKVLRETQNESYFTDNSNKYIIIPVFVKKIRKNSYGYEHAYFSLRFSLPQGIQPVSASDQEWYFESVNIEGYKKRKHIPHDLMNRHFQEKDGILTMGYSELIYTWYRKNYFKKI